MPAADNRQPESSGLHKDKAAWSDAVGALATSSLGRAVQTLLTDSSLSQRLHTRLGHGQSQAPGNAAE